MASIPGAQFSITGASGSTGLLGPRSGWFCYVFPRGAWASQDSTGTLITFDTADIASRFAVNDWIQAGLLTANIRQVGSVGGNSINVSGAALTVSEDNRVFLIGKTQPSTSGGSATYTIPATVVRHRDDDSSDRFTNSMVTSNSDGLIAFYGPHGIYDVLVQDGNQGNQGYIADVAVGMTEGVSTTLASVFGATVTINAALGVTGFLTADTVTVNRALGVTGWATFGQTVTMNSTLGVTGAATLSGWATFGSTVTMNAALGVTGIATFGATVTVATGNILASAGDFDGRRLLMNNGTALVVGDVALSAGWGDSASVTLNDPGNEFDTRAMISITANGAGIAANPSVTVTWKDGTYPDKPRVVAMRTNSTAPSTAFWLSNPTATTGVFDFIGTPVAGSVYGLVWVTFG